jgi:hypothetical protein
MSPAYSLMSSLPSPSFASGARIACRVTCPCATRADPHEDASVVWEETAASVKWQGGRGSAQGTHTRGGQGGP